MNKIKIKKEYIAPLVSLILVALTLIFSLTIHFNDSLGWFASNKSVEANGMSVSINGMPETEIYFIVNGSRIKEDDATNLFQNLRPGDKVQFQLFVENKSESKIQFHLSMKAPTNEQDTPVVIGDRYYYFGSQLRINYIKNGSNDVMNLTGNNRFLLPLDDSLYRSGLQPTSITSEFDFTTLSERLLTDSIVLNVGESVTLDFEIEFVDNNTLQNAYIDFGNNDNQKLARTLICYVQSIS